MSISFKINKIKDSNNKPTVFERLGMKSSRSSVCPSYLKTGQCQLGSKCTYEHGKRSGEESYAKPSKDEGFKGGGSKSKKEDSKSKNSFSKQSSTEEGKLINESNIGSEGNSNKNNENDEKEAGKKQSIESSKDAKKRSGKMDEGDKRNSKSSFDKPRKKDNGDKVEKRIEGDKKFAGDDKKHNKTSKEEDKKKRIDKVEKNSINERAKVKSGEKLKGRRRKRRYSSSSSQSSRSGSSSRGRRRGRPSKGTKRVLREGDSKKNEDVGLEGASNEMKEGLKLKKHSPPARQSKHSPDSKAPQSASPLHSRIHSSQSKKFIQGAQKADYFGDFKYKPSYEGKEDARYAAYKSLNKEDGYYMRDKGNKTSSRDSRKAQWERRREMEESEGRRRDVEEGEGRRRDVEEGEEDRQYRSKQRWSDECGSPRRSRGEEVSKERGLMDPNRGKKVARRSEDRFMDGDAYRTYRHDRPSSRASPAAFHRSKRERSEGEREARHSSNDSIRNYDFNDSGGRRSDGYRGSLRRSGSRSSVGSRRATRFYEKQSPMARGRMNLGSGMMLPPHPIQPLPPPPSSYDFMYNLPRPPLHSELQAPGKILALGKVGMNHGGPEFWEGRRVGGGGINPTMPPPQFRGPMPHPSYRPPLHHLPMADYRFEHRMPLPMTTSFPSAAHPPPIMDDFKARKPIKPLFHPTTHANKPAEGKSEASSSVEKEREPLKGLSVEAYEDVSEDELKADLMLEEETEEIDDVVVGDDDDLSDVDKAYLSLPKKIEIVETLDVDWSTLIGGGSKGADNTVMENTVISPFDEIGLSKPLAGEELYKELQDFRINADIKNKKVKSEKNGGDDDADNSDDSGFLDEVALYHVDECRRRRRLGEVGKMMGGVERALYARKDLMVRRILCQLNEEEDILYPGLSQTTDIYKEAVNLFKAKSPFLAPASS